MFIVNANDGVCSTNYSTDFRFDHLSEEILLGLPAKVLHTIAYFGFYKLPTWMGADPVLMSLSYERCR